MSGSGLDPIDWLKKVADSATRVRLAPGVLGKSAFLTYGVAIAWVVVLCRLSASLIQDGLLIGSAVLFTLYAMRETKKMRDYAIANPALALMEGADITEHQKFEAQAKGQLAVTSLVLSTNPSRPVIPGIPKQGPEENG